MSSRRKQLLAVLGFLLASFALSAWMHDLRGALDSGFGWSDDEAAHMVSGVMIHDYLTHPTPANPLEYAKRYYMHYPKVGIGQWPPGYHALQALWTLLFGLTRASVVLFGAALAAGVASLLFAALYRSRGALTAGAAGLGFLCLPLVQHFSAMPGTEVLIALFSFAAVMAFGCFLDEGRARCAFAFGGLATCAILTKGNALALALVPPLAILLRRQWGVLRSPALWSAALLVAIVAGPWTLWFLSVNRSTWGGGASLSADYALRASTVYASGLWAAGGPLVLMLAGWGAWRRVREPGAAGLWSSAFSWCVAVLAFHIAIPSSIEARHLVLLLPCLCLFAAEGARDLVGRYRQLPQRLHAFGGASLFLAGFALFAWEFPRKDFHGYDEAVEYIRSQRQYDGLSVLIDSGAKGEGLAVSEFVLADERPDRHVVRATKFLSHSTWIGEDYVELYPELEQLAAALDSAPIGLVLFDWSMVKRCAEVSHRETLQELLEGENWRLVERFDIRRNHERLAGALELWERVDQGRATPFYLDFADLVGRELPGVE